MLGLESLESRQYLTLLGVAPTVPIITYNSTGLINYSAANHTFDLTATPLFFVPDSSTVATVDTAPDFAHIEIHFKVDNSGNLIGSGSAANDLVITGDIDVDGDGNYDYTGTLLTGQIQGFGYQYNGSTTNNFDLRFDDVGGALAPLFGTNDIAMNVSSEHSTFTNDFTVDFTGGAKGNIGATPPLPGSISGIKYQDTTGDGFSADDTPLGGTTIDLYNDADNNGVPDGGIIATTTTASGTGAYSFGNLQPGTYIVEEEVAAGYQQTAPGSVFYDVTVGDGQNVTGKNFDNEKLGSISGTKYQDLTGNGFSSDDTALGGVTINLFKDNGDGVLTAADGAAVATSTSASGTGAYSFNNLVPGTYFVQEVVPSGYAQTAGGTYKVVMTGQTVTGDNFDNEKLGSISGYKYLDLTGNGFSSDDTALGGVTINLFKDNGDGVLTAADGAAVASTTTASGTGAYSFNNLAPGTYFVQEVVPSGYAQTAGGTYKVVMTGQVCTGDNFDNAKVGSISGIKYLDLTGNGFSSDDTPLGGVTINLFKDNGDGVLTAADGAAVASTTTATGTGAYSFNNLLPGTYFVQEVVPSGYSQTAGGTYKVVMTGQVCTGDNFDNVKLGSISGIKYQDLKGDGFSSDDTPLSGVTIQLFKDVNGDGVLSSADGSAIASTTTAAYTGAYSFNNLTPGKYLVSEVVPTGWIRTGPATVGYYAATIAGNAVTGDNFDDYQLGTCIQNVKSFSFKVGNTTCSDLTGNTSEGQKVTVTFTIKAGSSPMVYSLVVYKAPGPSFDPNTSKQQTIYQVATGTFGPGTYTMSVTLPFSYYQVDFICGTPLAVLGPAGSNIYYSQENRLIDSDNNGTNSDITGLSAQAKFWAGSTGQALIKSLNATSGNTNPTTLANWLAATFPKLAGANAGSSNLTGKHDTDVAAAMLSLYNSGNTVSAELLATALDIYVSTTSLGGATSAITTAGFTPTTAGLGAATFNVGSDGAAFGVSNNTTKTVLQLLQGANSLAVNGNAYNGNSSLKNQAVDLLTLVDQYGLVS